MDLFIANCSKQGYNFTFKLPESRNKFAHEKIDIPAGTQAQIRNLSGPAKTGIIDQYAPYGMREFSEVKRSRSEFVGLIWSEDEIVLDNITATFVHNMEVLDEAGKQLRADAAVEVDKSLLTTAPAGSELKSTTVQVVETQHHTRPDTEINHTVTVKPEPGGQPRVGAVDPSTVRLS